jgi:hypothetical protein
MEIDGIEVKPCVGCGHCCRTGPCGLANKFNLWRKPEDGGCRALRWNGEKWRCNLVSMDSQYAADLYIGDGCSSSLFNTDRKNIPTPEIINARHRKEVSPDVDWKKVLRFFVGGMARSFMSGDALYLAVLSLKPHFTEEEFAIITSEIIHSYKENTSKIFDGFIGTDILEKNNKTS